MRVSIQGMVVLLSTAAAAAPAGAIVNYQDDAQSLPKVVIDLNVDRLNEAFELQTVAEKFWAEVGQRYDGMAELRNIGGEFRAVAVHARFCLPRCGPAVLQESALIQRRPRETFRGAFSRAYARGQLSQRLSSGPPGPAATRRIGEYPYGTSFCIYGDCGLGALMGSSLACATSIDGVRFCARF